jgi:glycosyltransferase involved in cell wall biosynthesis
MEMAARVKFVSLMRILHLSNHIRNSGNGIVNVLVDLACAQRRAGCTVAVASSGGEFEELLRDHDVTHFRLGQARPSSLVGAAAAFRRLAGEFQPEIVHAHMMTGALLAYLLRWRLGYRLVTTVHNEWQRTAILMGLGDRVIAISDAVAASMTSRGVPSAKIRVVRNGPLGSPRTADQSKQEPMTLHRPAIVTIAGMYRRKGIIPLLDAFAEVLQRHPAAHLYVVGDGPDRARFEAKAADLAISANVHFTGFQPDPGRYLRGADVFVLASLAEPFGLVIAEAREVGLPIIATNVGGIPEALDGGAAGTLVPANDPGALARALRQLIGDPAQLSLGRARAGHNLEWLSVERMNSDTMKVYEGLIDDR